MSANATIVSGTWGKADTQASTSIYGFSLYEGPGDPIWVAYSVHDLPNIEPEIPAGYEKTGDYPTGATLPPVDSLIRQTSTVFTNGTPNFYSSDGSTIDDKQYSDFKAHPNGLYNLWILFDEAGEVVLRATQFELNKIFTRSQFNSAVSEFGETPDGGATSAPVVPADAEPRNPLLYLRRSQNSITYVGECGEAIAECGEESIECGNSSEPAGYPLVNKILLTTADLLALAGESGIECGETEASCGFYTSFTTERKDYVIPIDQNTWPYFTYIGGESFGAQAQVPASRKNEFETLCLKICPTHQWLGIMVDFV